MLPIPITPRFFPGDRYLVSDDEVIAERWNQRLDGLGPERLQALRKVVEDGKLEVARKFYEIMLGNEETHIFVNQELVQTRLIHTLQDWYVSLFRPNDYPECLKVVREQRRLGELHARMNIPFRLMFEAFRVVKEVLHRDLYGSSLNREDLTETILAADVIIDESVALMNATYLVHALAVVRNDEVYRQFAKSQRVEIEYQQVRNSLLDWLRGTLTTLFDTSSSGPKKSTYLSSSPFGLWIAHKADLVFPDSDEISYIHEIIAEIDGVLKELAVAKDKPQSLYVLNGIKKIDQGVTHILELLSGLLDSGEKRDGYLDSVTLLLDQRFEETVLQHEVRMAQSRNQGFTAALLAIDRFVDLVASYGEATANLILQQVASVISNKLRPNDFAFRHDEMTVLIILTDSDEEQMQSFISRIADYARNNNFSHGDRTGIHITVSAGISTFRGHPDFLKVITAAQAALQSAQAAGIDSIVTALSDEAESNSSSTDAG